MQSARNESRLTWVPDGVDIQRPNPARVYDYYLGGGHNFASDREHAERVIAVFPDAQALARRARVWLRIAVHALAAEYGIDQFLDLGAGIPSPGCTHEVARRVNPAARVVYVDNEPVAVASSRLMVETLDGVEVVDADFTQPHLVLRDPMAVRTLDFSRPMAVLFSCALHLIPDERDPAGTVAGYRDATAPGSYLAISHGTSDNRPDLAEVSRLYQNASNPFITRTYAEIAALFAGYELLPPGLAFTALWRPEGPVEEDEAIRSGCYAAVARKPLH